jgi:Na+-translocating ferredoxin:NAD+ oxidoreductase RnfG subunit
MSDNLLLRALVGGICVVATQSSYAETYFTQEEVLKALFPSATSFVAQSLTLNKTQTSKIEDSSPTSTPIPNKIWQVREGDKALGYVIIDKVLGRHEFITYAVALDTQGHVQGIEVIEYLESYGHQIRNEKWRAQFADKKQGDPLKLTKDIQNIAGATLSCKHITEGVRRIVALYEFGLKKT